MAKRQMAMQMELLLEGTGEARRVERSGEARLAAGGDERSGIGDLMEKIVERENCLRALGRVRRNKGSPGIDGMRVEELPKYLRENWERIRAELLVESIDPEGPYGAKEAGEGPLHPSIPAIANAIYDAVGIRMDALPFSPPRVWSALQEHAAGGEARIAAD